MTQYIDKAAVIAEIEKRINGVNPDTIEDWRYRLQWEHDIEVMKNILSLINTIEVKEVDLEKEIDDWYNTMGIPVTTDALKETARYFFELGLRASQNKQ